MKQLFSQKCKDFCWNNEGWIRWHLRLSSVECFPSYLISGGANPFKITIHYPTMAEWIICRSQSQWMNYAIAFWSSSNNKIWKILKYSGSKYSSNIIPMTTWVGKCNSWNYAPVSRWIDKIMPRKPGYFGHSASLEFISNCKIIGNPFHNHTIHVSNLNWLPLLI